MRVYKIKVIKLGLVLDRNTMVLTFFVKITIMIRISTTIVLIIILIITERHLSTLCCHSTQHITDCQTNLDCRQAVLF